MAIGHVMLDLQDLFLSQQENEMLAHPQVGGVILFSRNYESKKQLGELIKAIRKKAPECLIAVDQEGGRVQRFREGFLTLPPFRVYGELYQQNKEEALNYAQTMAFTMARELKEVGVDMSFTPVLDIDYGKSKVIGDRSFSHQSEVVIDLGRAFIKGMHRAGMPATGKHFPGHGSVAADSHLTLPLDDRSYDCILQEDLQPFIKLQRELDAVMPAHILYEQVDCNPPCFSPFWLQEILRTKLNFSGVIFSDDLSMAGAGFVADYVERARKALAAGCDMILVCNHQSQAINVLADLEDYINPGSAARLSRFNKLSY